jgi:hypothetical protein
MVKVTRPVAEAFVVLLSILDQFRRWRGRAADPVIWRVQRAHVQSQQYRLAARVSPLFQPLRAMSEYHLQQPDIRLPSILQ